MNHDGQLECYSTSGVQRNIGLVPVAVAIGGLGLWQHGYMLRRGKKDGQSVFAPKEGQSSPLRSSKSPSDCSSFGFINVTAAEDEALKRLAEILVESFLLQKTYGITKQ